MTAEERIAAMAERLPSDEMWSANKLLKWMVPEFLSVLRAAEQSARREERERCEAEARHMAEENAVVLAAETEARQEAEREALKAIGERDEARRERAFYQDREKYFAALLKVTDGGQYRADWDGAVARLKDEAREAALGEVLMALQTRCITRDDVVAWARETVLSLKATAPTGGAK
jgi:hypothetical protein